MRCLIPGLLLFTALLNAQDRVYLMDGRERAGQLRQVGPDSVLLSTVNGLERYSMGEVVLLRYGNGEVQLLNDPGQDQLYSAAGSNIAQRSIERPEPGNNLVAFNAAGIVNSDITFSYERLVLDRAVGLGGFSGFNFNGHSSLLNAYIFPLHNSKKVMDAGIYINHYRRQFERPRTFYYGFMLKYSFFRFTALSEASVTSGSVTTTNINYSPATGSQLAFMFSLGRHRQITEKFYVRSLYSFGFFNLKGEYARQYNYFFNQNVPTPVRITTLPKVFIGFFVGYKL